MHVHVEYVLKGFGIKSYSYIKIKFFNLLNRNTESFGNFF